MRVGASAAGAEQESFLAEQRMPCVPACSPYCCASHLKVESLSVVMKADLTMVWLVRDFAGLMIGPWHRRPHIQALDVNSEGTK